MSGPLAIVCAHISTDVVSSMDRCRETQHGHCLKTLVWWRYSAVDCVCDLTASVDLLRQWSACECGYWRLRLACGCRVVRRRGSVLGTDLWWLGFDCKYGCSAVDCGCDLTVSVDLLRLWSGCECGSWRVRLACQCRFVRRRGLVLVNGHLALIKPPRPPPPAHLSVRIVLRRGRSGGSRRMVGVRGGPPGGGLLMGGVY